VNGCACFFQQRVVRFHVVSGSKAGQTENATKGCSKMRNFIASFVRDESGAAAAEYALILAIVAAGIAVAVTALGTSISTAIHNAGTYITIAPAS